MVTGKTQEPKIDSLIINLLETAEEDELRNAAKEKGYAVYVAKRVKASASAVDFSKKYAIKNIVTRTKRQRRHSVLELNECLKDHDLWKELVMDNDEVENIGLRGHFCMVISPDFTVRKNNRLAKNKELLTKYHFEVFMIRWEQQF